MVFESVRTERLLKLYGATCALRDVSLTFSSGEVTVVEGPNGSGKSTLLAILGLLARPTAGVLFFGSRASERVRASARHAIGVLSHEPMLYPELTGRENLQFFGQLFAGPNAPRAATATRIEELVERFALRAFVDRPTGTYSRGQLQRVALSRALIHHPKLLLLDEPSTGLDEGATELLWSAVAKEQSLGSIVVLVTHDARCADVLGGRRVFLKHGRVDRIVPPPAPPS